MRGSDRRSGELFSYVDVETRIRPDHPLRTIKAIAYRTPDERIVVNPAPWTVVEADKLFVLVREGNARADGEIAALLPDRR